MTDPFRHDAAPYVLGALAPEERYTFEEHRAGCVACDAAVRDFAGLPGLLARLPATEVPMLDDAEPAVPPTLMPALLGTVRRQRRSARRRTWVAGLAAASVVGAGSVATVRVLDTGSSTLPPAAVQHTEFLPVAENVTVVASAALVSKPWGTEIDLRCQHKGTGYKGHPVEWYRLVAVDDEGRDHDVSDWSVPNNNELRVPGATSLDRDEISALEIRGRSDSAVLRLSL